MAFATLSLDSLSRLHSAAKPISPDPLGNVPQNKKVCLR